MSSLELVFFAGFLISIGHSFELFGFFFRLLGTQCGKPSVGYSSHVQIATFSRFSTLIAMPIVGYLLDIGAASIYVILIPVIALSFFSLLCVLQIYLSYKKNMLVIFFRFFAKVVSRIDVYDSIHERDLVELPKANKMKQIKIAGFLAYFIVSGGVFLIYIVSASFLDYRAMILQSAPILTAFGTFISVVFFDSAVSNTLDSYKVDMEFIRLIIISRLCAALALLALFIIVLLFKW
ncbi:hypothetical protein PALB_11420 [Pseudoalteromonas luteoviolacea B = ATCC 29581]|nr:hypothetical protein PALB_11420 [Pseudoalteromonas luteoviolacea B = ATCC 29581]